MSICRMGKPSYNRGNQAMAPGEQNARPGVKTLVNFRFVIVFSLFVFFSSPAVVSAYHRMLFFPQEALSVLHLQGILLMLC